MGLVLPAAEQDLKLTPAAKSAMSSCVFLGMLLGGLLWGPMADAVGEPPLSFLTSVVLLHEGFYWVAIAGLPGNITN